MRTVPGSLSLPGRRFAQGAITRTRQGFSAAPLFVKILLLGALVFLAGPLFGILLVIAIIYAPFAVWAGHRSVLASLSVAAWGLAVMSASGAVRRVQTLDLPAARAAVRRGRRRARRLAGPLVRAVPHRRAGRWASRSPSARAPLARRRQLSYRPGRRLADRAAWCWAGGWPRPRRTAASSAGSRPAAVPWPHPRLAASARGPRDERRAPGHADRAETAPGPSTAGRREPPGGAGPAGGGLAAVAGPAAADAVRGQCVGRPATPGARTAAPPEVTVDEAMAELDNDDRPDRGQGAGPVHRRLDRGGPPARGGRVRRPKSRCSTSCSSARRAPARPRSPGSSPRSSTRSACSTLRPWSRRSAPTWSASTWARPRSRPTSWSTRRSAGCCSSTRPTAWSMRATGRATGSATRPCRRCSSGPRTTART